MCDIETYAEHLGEWNSLTEAHEGPFITISDFTDQKNGTYTYRLERPAGTAIVSYKVDGVLIESQLETIIEDISDGDNKTLDAVELDVREGSIEYGYTFQDGDEIVDYETATFGEYMLD